MRRRGVAPALDHFSKRLPEIFRQHGVDEGVHAGIHVAQNVRRDLDGDREVGDFIEFQ